MQRNARADDTGFMVYAQNCGMVVRDFFVATRPTERLRRHQSRITVPEAKRLAWGRLLDLAARLEREGYPNTFVKVEFLEPGKDHREVFFAMPGSPNWRLLLEAIAKRDAADENRHEVEAAKYECAA